MLITANVVSYRHIMENNNTPQTPNIQPQVSHPEAGDLITDDNPFIVEAGSQYQVRSPEERAADAAYRTQQEIQAAEDSKTLGEIVKDAVVDTAKAHPGVSIAGAAAAAALIIGGAALESGNTKGPEHAEISDNIYSVTLNENAPLRFDPFVIDKDGETNRAYTLDEEGTIVAVGKTKVINDTPDGTWYGFSTDFVRDAGLNLSGADIDRLQTDQDGTVWVNIQNVVSVQNIDEVDPATGQKK